MVWCDGNESKARREREERRSAMLTLRRSVVQQLQQLQGVLCLSICGGLGAGKELDCGSQQLEVAESQMRLDHGCGTPELRLLPRWHKVSSPLCLCSWRRSLYWSRRSQSCRYPQFISCWKTQHAGRPAAHIFGVLSLSLIHA